MHYSFEVDVTQSHTAADPLVVPIELSGNILVSCEFLFEVGDGFSSCVQIWDDDNQLLPSNEDGFYSADGLLVTAPCDISLPAISNTLYIIAWNRGGVYAHSVNVFITTIHSEYWNLRDVDR